MSCNDFACIRHDWPRVQQSSSFRERWSRKKGEGMLQEDGIFYCFIWLSCKSFSIESVNRVERDDDDDAENDAENGGKRLQVLFLFAPNLKFFASNFHGSHVSRLESKDHLSLSTDDEQGVTCFVSLLAKSRESILVFSSCYTLLLSKVFSHLILTNNNDGDDGSQDASREIQVKRLDLNLLWLLF